MTAICEHGHSAVSCIPCRAALDARLAQLNSSRCDCHECTQAPYVGTFAWQLDQERKLSTDQPSASETHSDKEKQQ